MYWRSYGSARARGKLTTNSPEMGGAGAWLIATTMWQRSTFDIQCTRATVLARQKQNVGYSAFVSTDSKRLVVYFKRKLVSKEHKQAKDSVGLRIPMD